MGYLSLKLDSQDQGVPISNLRNLGGFASVSRFVTYDYGDSPHNCKPGFGYFAENELANHQLCAHNIGMKIESNIKFTQDFTVHDFLETFSNGILADYMDDFGQNGWDNLVSCTSTFEVIDLLEPYIPADYAD